MGSPTWELADPPAPPAPVSQDQLLRMILSRQVSLQSFVRPAPDRPWASIAATEPFLHACPVIRLGEKPAKVERLDGVFTVGSNPDHLIAVARMTRTLPSFPKLGFFVPILADQPGPPFTTAGALFQVWDGIFVGAVCETHFLRPQMFLHMYLVAFNLSRVVQQHRLIVGGTPIPPDQLPALDFTLPPMRWSARRLNVPVPQRPGEHKFEFRSQSGAAKAGKAIAAGILTLGTCIWVPGHKGFTFTAQVLDPPALKDVDDFESAVLRAAGGTFTEAGVEHATTAGGMPVPRKDFMERFRQYLWYNPERTIKALQREDPQEAYAQLLGRYMWEEWGDEVNLPEPPGTPANPPVAPKPPPSAERAQR